MIKQLFSPLTLTPYTLKRLYIVLERHLNLTKILIFEKIFVIKYLHKSDFFSIQKKRVEHVEIICKQIT